MVFQYNMRKANVMVAAEELEGFLHFKNAYLFLSTFNFDAYLHRRDEVDDMVNYYGSSC